MTIQSGAPAMRRAGAGHHQHRRRPTLALRLALAGWLASTPAWAQGSNPEIARELRPPPETATTAAWHRARDVFGAGHVKVVITRDSDDAALANPRSALMAASGSIHHRDSTALALADMLPARQVAGIASRADVQGNVPRRPMVPTATQGHDAAVTDLIGRGSVIARLGSGIRKQPAGFKGDGNDSRGRQATSSTQAGDAVRAIVRDGTPGLDASRMRSTASPARQAFTGRLQTSFGGKTDRFGHGPRVAAAAAGRGNGQQATGWH
jgi:hypothetical protein